MHAGERLGERAERAGLGLLAPPTAPRCLAAPPASREGGEELQSSELAQQGLRQGWERFLQPSTGWEREPPDHPRLPGGERRAGSRLWVAGSTQAGGGRTFRMLVTVGSALRMSLGLGWMLAFSADFRCGACSLSAILGTHKEGRLAGGGGAALLPPKPPQGSAGGHSEGTGSALSWLAPKAKPQPPPGQGAGQPAAPQPVLPAPREEER